MVQPLRPASRWNGYGLYLQKEQGIPPLLDIRLSLPGSEWTSRPHRMRLDTTHKLAHQFREARVFAQAGGARADTAFVRCDHHKTILALTSVVPRLHN